jgi:phenylpyruvate tautomerase PptA (4-oxalocrotonate tautomerase family)
VRAIIYVEGPSDRLAMERLLRHLIETKRQAGVDIQFFEVPSRGGDRKAALLTKIPRRAVDILRNDPDSVVVAMPDLYPRNKAFEHETAEQLIEGIRQAFLSALSSKGLEDQRLVERFHAFCFKHDLEALLLAAEAVLANRLGSRDLKRTWQTPVEDQNHDNPPKRVVEELFREHGKRYVGTADAPVILAAANYQDIAERCPQCFAPFIEFLEKLD